MTSVGHHIFGHDIPKEAEAPQVALSTQPETLARASEGAQPIVYSDRPWKESGLETRDERNELKPLTDDGLVKPRKRHMRYSVVALLTFLVLGVGIGVGVGIGRATAHPSR